MHGGGAAIGIGPSTRRKRRLIRTKSSAESKTALNQTELVEFGSGRRLAAGQDVDRAAVPRRLHVVSELAVYHEPAATEVAENLDTEVPDPPPAGKGSAGLEPAEARGQRLRAPPPREVAKRRARASRSAGAAGPRPARTARAAASPLPGASRPRVPGSPGPG